MKRLLSFILSFVLLFSLVACGETVNELKINFDEQGGTAVEDMTVNEQNVLNFSLPTTTKEGYVFNGWYLDIDFSEGFKVEDLVKLLTEKKEITLYARWEEDKKEEVFTIELDPNGGILETTKLEYTISNPVKLPTPTKEGFDFKGWYNENDEIVTEVKEGSVKLTAKWEEIKEPLSFINTKVTQKQTLTIRQNGENEVSFGLQAIVAVQFKELGELSLDSLNTLDGKVSLEVTIDTPDDTELAAINGTYAVSLYIKDDYLFVELSDSLNQLLQNMNVPLGQYFKINIPELIEFVKLIIEENNDQVSGDLSFDFEAILEKVMAKANEIIEEILAKATEAGLTEELLQQFIDVISKLLPTVTEENGKKIITITDKQVKEAANELLDLTVNNLFVINNIFEELGDTISGIFNDFSDDDDKVIDYENGGIYVDGVYHSFADEDSSWYGITDSNLGIFICYYDFDYIFIISEGYKGYKGSYDGYVYYFDGEEQVHTADGVISFAADAASETPQYGHITEEGLYFNKFNECYYRLNPFTKLTKEEAFELQTDEIRQVIAYIKENLNSIFTINQVEVTIDEEQMAIKILVDIAINTEKLVEIYDIESINMNISLSSETKIDNFEEAPNYEINPDRFVDLTELIKMIISSGM